jgi:glycosyltransferase involved in cell wall biosynthesis
MTVASSSDAPGSVQGLPVAAHGRLLVILPALNEASTLEQVLRRVPRDIPGIAQVDLLVVDDGSSDDTVRLALEAGASVVSHGKNLGVGAAVQTGLDEAVRRRFDFAVNIDADGQFSPEDIPKLLEPITSGRADFVTASRFKDPALAPRMPLAKRWGNWGMARIVSSIVGLRFEDVSCGFRAYSRETLLRLVLMGGFTYTQEMFLVLAQKGLRILEVPMQVRGVREAGKSRVASNLFRYGYRTLGIIFSVLRDHSPGAIFNRTAAVLFFLATCSATFFIGYRLYAGKFSPNIWSGFVAAFLYGLSFLTFAMGQIALMISRVRVLQERQLYLLRKYLQRPDE